MVLVGRLSIWTESAFSARLRVEVILWEERGEAVVVGGAEFNGLGKGTCLGVLRDCWVMLCPLLFVVMNCKRGCSVMGFSPHA